MATTTSPAGSSWLPSFLQREATVAPPGFNRWLIPPAALAVHLCIGQVYATSVYKNALVAHFDTSLTAIGIIFSIAIVMLGLSAATLGTWVDHNGPRAAMVAAALFWSAGFLVGALGISSGQLWLVYLGYGVIGGIGLGIGYISPVSTLIKWFPDRPGLATGMAIMGFGGGALIASPLSGRLLALYDSGYDATDPTSIASGGAVASLFVTLGLGYLVFMLFGAFTVRVPADDWKPEGWDPSQVSEKKLVTTASVSAANADPDPAVLAALGGAVLQRDRRHRHPGAGRADDPGLLPRRRRLDRERGRRGRLRRPAVDLQHGWPVRLVVHLRRDRPQADLHGLPRRRHGALRAARARRPDLDRAVRAARRRDHLVLRRRVRDGPGVPARPVRHVRGRRHPRPAAHRLVRRRRRRTADREQVPRRRGHARRADRRRLPAGAAHHGGAARDRVRRATC